MNIRIVPASGGRRVGLPIALITAVILGAGTRASATIASLSSDWCQTCLPGFPQRIVAGKTMTVLVKGTFVDLATRVEITGSGVQAGIGARTGGSSSSVEIKFVVDPQASLGPRTVRLRYAIETNGPDTFQVATPGDALFRFFYGGAPTVTVTGASAAPPRRVSGPIASGAAAPAPFLDVAPRANMLNVFRRSGSPVSVGGRSFVPVDDSWCAQNALQSPPAGSASKLITVPNPIWGISNVGTAQVGTAFLARLSTNGQTLEQSTVAANSLAPGATQNAAFTRPRSTVRVVRFGPPNPPGCFASPNDPNFFEDPPFTVQADVNGVLPESAAARANNSRTY